jgi:hypothetical protein
MIFILPTPKYALILYNIDISISFNSIANAGTICQFVRPLLFLQIDTENEDSPFENSITQLGSSLAFILVLVL